MARKRQKGGKKETTTTTTTTPLSQQSEDLDDVSPSDSVGPQTPASSRVRSDAASPWTPASTRSRSDAVSSFTPGSVLSIHSNEEAIATSPELAQQVEDLNTLLAAQRGELGGDTPLNSTREEDDDLESEIGQLAASEELLRRELELLQAGKFFPDNEEYDDDDDEETDLFEAIGEETKGPLPTGSPTPLSRQTASASGVSPIRSSTPTQGSLIIGAATEVVPRQAQQQEEEAREGALRHIPLPSPIPHVSTSERGATTDRRPDVKNPATRTLPLARNSGELPPGEVFKQPPPSQTLGTRHASSSATDSPPYEKRPPKDTSGALTAAATTTTVATTIPPTRLSDAAVDPDFSQSFRPSPLPQLPTGRRPSSSSLAERQPSLPSRQELTNDIRDPFIIRRPSQKTIESEQMVGPELKAPPPQRTYEGLAWPPSTVQSLPIETKEERVLDQGVTSPSTSHRDEQSEREETRGHSNQPAPLSLSLEMADKPIASSRPLSTTGGQVTPEPMADSEVDVLLAPATQQQQQQQRASIELDLLVRSNTEAVHMTDQDHGQGALGGDTGARSLLGQTVKSWHVGLHPGADEYIDTINANYSQVSSVTTRSVADDSIGSGDSTAMDSTSGEPKHKETHDSLHNTAGVAAANFMAVSSSMSFSDDSKASSDAQGYGSVSKRPSNTPAALVVPLSSTPVGEAGTLPPVSSQAEPPLALHPTRTTSQPIVSNTEAQSLGLLHVDEGGIKRQRKRARTLVNFFLVLAAMVVIVPASIVVRRRNAGILNMEASIAPSSIPSLAPTESFSPSLSPFEIPSVVPTSTQAPTGTASLAPSRAPRSTELTQTPSIQRTSTPSIGIIDSQTFSPTESPPTQFPTNRRGLPTNSPTQVPILSTPVPSLSPTLSPTRSPSETPVAEPASGPSEQPSLTPTLPPQTPTNTPTSSFTDSPSTLFPTVVPTAPGLVPTLSPTEAPLSSPTTAPTQTSSLSPTSEPTTTPSIARMLPTFSPTQVQPPTNLPIFIPPMSPSPVPTQSPTRSPSDQPTHNPSLSPTATPTTTPSTSPVVAPTNVPTTAPSASPVVAPTRVPTTAPSASPVVAPTRAPSVQLTRLPTLSAEQALFSFLDSIALDGGESLRDPNSPQFAAYEWLAGNANLDSYSEERLIQRYSLATLFKSAGGASWSENGLWLSDEDECDWYSRAPDPCGPGDSFWRLELFFNNAEGTIPPEIALLSNRLVSIDISGGPLRVLTGGLPSEYGLLTRLSELRLSNNNLVGNIPSQYGGLVSLKQIDLSNNNLSGTLSPEIGEWTSLTSLNLAGNRLEGSLPSEISRWSKVSRLTLEDNFFSGGIATEIGLLANLRVLSLSNNRLTDFPSDVGLLTRLVFLLMDDNLLGGTLHTEIGQLQDLRTLTFANNALQGSIPTEYGLLTMIREVLDLSKNQLSGRIPSELGRINSRLRGLRLNNNLFSGSVPSAFDQFTKLSELFLQSNDLTGVMPESVCTVFNSTLPTVYIDCEEVDCPCCTFCCTDEEGCVCRYLNTPQEFLCI